MNTSPWKSALFHPPVIGKLSLMLACCLAAGLFATRSVLADDDDRGRGGWYQQRGEWQGQRGEGGGWRNNYEGRRDDDGWRRNYDDRRWDDDDRRGNYGYPYAPPTYQPPVIYYPQPIYRPPVQYYPQPAYPPTYYYPQ